MNSTIPCANIKIWRQVLAVFAKIDEELYLEALDEGLKWKTLNLNSTCMLNAVFGLNFFAEYSVRPAKTAAEAKEGVKGKVYQKAVACLLKKYASLEKEIESISLKLDYDSDWLVSETRCIGDGIRIKRNIHLLEYESVHFNPDPGPVIRLRILASKMARALISFRPADADLTLSLEAKKVVLRNYSDLSSASGDTRTCFALKANEFIGYPSKGAIVVTFSLKPFREMVRFASKLEADVELAIEEAGKPIEVSLRTIAWSLSLVLATMNPPESEASQTPVPSLEPVDRSRLRTVFARCFKQQSDQQTNEDEAGDAELVPCTQEVLQKRFKLNHAVASSPDR